MVRKFCLVLLMVMVVLAACTSAPTGDSTPATTSAGTPNTTEQVVMATNTPPLDTPTPTQTLSESDLVPTASYTPFIFPLTLEPARVCAGAPPSRLIVNERARVGEDDPQALNLRDAAGLDSKVLGQLAVGSVFMVLEGPICGGNYSWFRVQSSLGEGWVAEGDSRVYFTEPFALP